MLHSFGFYALVLLLFVAVVLFAFGVAELAVLAGFSG
jgi:hypothetical protein